MPYLKVGNVAIRGISACVPPKVEENISLPIYATKEEAEKVIATTGVERKHIVSDGITASDLCLQAAQKLIEELGWDKDSIDALCFVTQTPDYINQPNSFTIHDRLNLKEDCMCIDLYHGCPGWVMGLQTLSSLMQVGGAKRALLLDGDCVTAHRYIYDSESLPLFGDCGTATALDFDSAASTMYFETGSRSKDGGSLIIQKGAMRHPFTLEEYKQHLDMMQGIEKPDESTMDGMSVFSFGITVPPKSIKRLCETAGIDLADVDKVVLHQANAFMIKKIVKKLKVVDAQKAPMSLKNYGNTTSASIPLTIVSQCGKEYSSKRMKTIGCGFGTGLAWATYYFETENIACPEVIIYNKEKNDQL